MKTKNPSQPLFAALVISLTLAGAASAQWTITDLGLLGDAEGNDSQAWSINNLGHVVGYAYRGPFDAPALLWRDGTFVNLSELPEVLAAGWSNITVRDVNDSDQVVGHGYHHGKLRAFLLSPATVPVPFHVNLRREVNGATLSFLSSAGTRYQILTATAVPGTDWEAVGDRLSDDPAVNFGTFLRDLLSAVPNALLNRGALAVRENQAETGPRYPTLKAFGQETQWLLWRLRGASPLTGAALAQDAPCLGLNERVLSSLVAAKLQRRHDVVSR